MAFKTFQTHLNTGGKGTDLSHWMSLAKNLTSHCEDIIVELKDLKIKEDLSLAIGGTDLQLTEWSSSQLCTTLGVPKTYISKCIAHGAPELAIKNLNYWLKEQQDKTMQFRLYDNYIRGIVSPKFAKFDAADAFDVIGNSVDMDQVDLVNNIITPERLHMRYVYKEPFLYDEVNSPLFTGIQISNSDVGLSCYNVSFFIYRQICTNGLKGVLDSNQVVNKKHIGTIDKILLGAQTKAFLDFAKDNEAIVKQTIENAAQQNLSAEQVTLDLKKKAFNLKLTDKEIVDIVDYQPITTKWDLVNNVTHIAKARGLDRRLELETFAGSLLKAAIA